ncbi:CsbD family protein [Streptomyces sp. GC420]|uniref:CsbD family protein n=1 Tax=Streptomyces sp. GC420 TaxID=2697568 RepID=UPI001414D933|nr:CsbD family protein [Streptomyces sp. GC420]NBM15324.1 CsbD family protein [Streptomyces sp. GC420]
MTARNSKDAQHRVAAKAEQAKGAVKHMFGRALGNESMTAKGRTERSKGALRQAGQKAKDAFRH